MERHCQNAMQVAKFLSRLKKFVQGFYKIIPCLFRFYSLFIWSYSFWILVVYFRDCDLLMYFEDNWLHQVIMGLKEEMKLTIEKILFGVITFIHEMKFSTTYGQEIYDQKSSQLIANVTRLLEILTIEK